MVGGAVARGRPFGIAGDELMATSTIPVDLRNPGQVFACLGLMEAAEILLGAPCQGAFGYERSETQTDFTLTVDGPGDPVAVVLQFLARAEAKALVPFRSALSTVKWGVEAVRFADVAQAGHNDGDVESIFPCPEPNSPAALPIILTDGKHSIPIEHWVDAPQAGRDSVKFWAGSGGYPGAALARDALDIIRKLGDNALANATGDPFALEAQQSSSFRFDWRRDYIPLDAGFSPNAQAAVKMIGYPLVELLAAIGLQNARPHRPDRRDKLAYRYGVSNAILPIQLMRAILGAQGLGFPMRVFRMRLGWPGQEGQARCIIDAQEEFTS
jgi:CRISPR-associated protein Csx14